MLRGGVEQIGSLLAWFARGRRFEACPRTRVLHLNKHTMKILTLIIKQKYFGEILSGEKNVETREIRHNNFKKYCEIDEEGYALFDEENGVFVPRQYDAIRFYVGYNKDRASALVEVKGANIGIFVDEEGKEIVYDVKGEEFLATYIDYDLGKVIEKNV